MSRRLLLAAAIVLVIGGGAFAAGFVRFANDVSAMRPPVAPRADAIVVLTGAADRIGDAVDLLAAGHARRLLISGVNSATSADAIASAIDIDRDLVACCVDLDRVAENTRGNAAETAAWASDHGFSSLIVVTSAYHMPRSLAELQSAMPDVTLVPYPVVEEGMDSWSDDGRSLRRLVGEYLKYLAVRARQAVLG